MLILVNTASHHGLGGERFRKVVPELKHRFQSMTIHEYHPPQDLTEVIRRELENGDRKIISAGGDGTLNTVVNCIMSIDPTAAATVTLGAIGLGSSNDALKPMREFISEIPVSIDQESQRRIDLGRMRMTKNDGAVVVRHFIANSGLGAIAAANRMFNEDDRITKLAKRLSIDAAISVVALRTIAQWKPRRVMISIDGEQLHTVDIDTLSIVKIPWISGGMRYDVEPGRDSGLLGIHLCVGAGRVGLVRLMYDLSRGRFSGRSGRSTFFARKIRIVADDDLEVEFDGEVESIREVEITVVPSAIQWMGG